MAGWGLFQEMDMLRREIEQAFKGNNRTYLNPSFLPGIGTGVEKNGLEINLEKGLLTISGEMALESRGKALLREFSTANYHRQFKVPEHIDADKASADLNNGVLTLTIPKSESAKPKRITIRH